MYFLASLHLLQAQHTRPHYDFNYTVLSSSVASYLKYWKILRNTEKYWEILKILKNTEKDWRKNQNILPRLSPPPISPTHLAPLWLQLHSIILISGIVSIHSESSSSAIPELYPCYHYCRLLPMALSLLQCLQCLPSNKILFQAKKHQNDIKGERHRERSAVWARRGQERREHQRAVPGTKCEEEWEVVIQ